MSLEKTVKEIEKNGLIIGFDHCATPFWFVKSSMGGRNIGKQELSGLISKEHIEELETLNIKWLEGIDMSNDDSEWKSDFNIKERLVTIAKKIKDRSGLKIYVHKLNKIEYQHYELEEI